MIVQPNPAAVPLDAQGYARGGRVESFSVELRVEELQAALTVDAYQSRGLALLTKARPRRREQLFGGVRAIPRWFSEQLPFAVLASFEQQPALLAVPDEPDVFSAPRPDGVHAPEARVVVDLFPEPELDRGQDVSEPVAYILERFPLHAASVGRGDGPFRQTLPSRRRFAEHQEGEARLLSRYRPRVGDFFVLESARWSQFDTEYLPTKDARYGDAPRREACGAFTGSMRWLPPFRVELILHGSRWGDFAFFGPEAFLLSEHALHAWRESGLSGLTPVDAVEVVAVKARSTPPPYYHVEVARDAASVDESRSAIVRIDPGSCDVCRSSIIDGIQGFSIDADSWTGEDVFIARGLPGTVVVTARVQEWIEVKNLSNARVTATPSFVWDPYAPVA